MTEKAWLTYSEPSATLPIYTRLNAGEVMPDPIRKATKSGCQSFLMSVTSASRRPWR